MDFCDDTLTHHVSLHAFSTRRTKLIKQISPQFRDEVPVKRSFAEIEEKEKKEIYMYVHIKNIYICMYKRESLYFQSRECNSESTRALAVHAYDDGSERQINVVHPQT